LTYTYNESVIQTYNLAYGGATVDSDLVAPYQPTVISMKSQIRDQFVPVYGNHPANAPWAAVDSLFAFWIGINDVGNSWWKNNSTLIDAIFAEYSGLLDEIYATGARNYLFLTVPPVNLAPLTLQNGNYSIENEGIAIQDWNTRTEKMSQEFGRRHNQSTTVFVHDTWGVFSKALQNPSSFPQTSGIKNTTSWCKAYENGTPSWYTLDATCTYPVNEYFWLNSLHPTFPMHNATAASIADFLDSASA
jgi:phospholipase/lecithinase/hemolysin